MTVGSGAVRDGSDNIVRSETGVHVTLAGVSDLIVVATGDTVMILPRARAQDVKTLNPKKA